MAYLESNLGRKEEIIAKAQISYLPVVPGVIFSILLSAFFFFLVGLGLTFVIAMGLFALFVLPKIASISNTELGLTNKRIMGKCGLLNTKVMDSPIGKVNSISVEQGLGGQIFGYSKIIISTSSGGFNFNYIKYADAFRNAVLEEMDKAEEERDRRQAEMLAGAMNRPEK